MRYIVTDAKQSHQSAVTTEGLALAFCSGPSSFHSTNHRALHIAMSDQPSPSKQGANVPEKKADKKPEDTPTPEQQTQHPVAALTLLLVNPNKHHENEMSKIHVTMLDLWEQEKAAEAEQLALLLLSYSTLPIPYRAFAHMVSPLLST
jgi:hypothetical protein